MLFATITALLIWIAIDYIMTGLVFYKENLINAIIFATIFCITWFLVSRWRENK